MLFAWWRWGPAVSVLWAAGQMLGGWVATGIPGRDKAPTVSVQCEPGSRPVRIFCSSSGSIKCRWATLAAALPASTRIADACSQPAWIPPPRAFQASTAWVWLDRLCSCHRRSGQQWRQLCKAPTVPKLCWPGKYGVVRTTTRLPHSTLQHAAQRSRAALVAKQRRSSRRAVEHGLQPGRAPTVLCDSL